MLDERWRDSHPYLWEFAEDLRSIRLTWEAVLAFVVALEALFLIGLVS